MRSPIVSVDTETASSDPNDKKGALKTLRCILKGVSIAWEDKGRDFAHYWNFNPEDMPVEEAAARWNKFRDKLLKPLFKREVVVMAFHNATFDLKVFHARGLHPQTRRLSDTMVMDFLLDENRPHDLKSCARDHLGVIDAASHAATQKEVNTIIKAAEKEAKEVGHVVWEDYRDFQKGTMQLSDIHNLRVRELIMALPEKTPKVKVLARAYQEIGRYIVRKAHKKAQRRFADYARKDALWTLQLHKYLLPKIQDEGFGQIYWNLYQSLIRQTLEMEIKGVKVDLEKLRVIQEMLAEKSADILAQIHRKFGQKFNPGSSVQVKDLLWKQKQLTPPPWLKKSDFGKDGLPSSGEAVIEWLVRCGERDLEDLLVYRKLTKTKSTYIDALIYEAEMDPEGRIHTSFSIIKKTARFGSSNINLQNIPRWTTLQKYIPDIPSIRACFVPEEGKVLLVADLSQCDLRCMAHFTRDPAFWKAYRTWKCPACKKTGETNKPYHACPICGEPDKDGGGTFICGEDIHMQTAVQTGLVKKLGKKAGRDRAKNVNFAAVYLVGPNTLATMLELPVDETKLILEGYHRAHPGVHAYANKITALVEAQGYFRMLNGQKRRFTKDLEKIRQLESVGSENASKEAWRQKYALTRELMNNVGQCGTAIIINTAMFLLWRKREVLRKAGINLLLQVHDELVFEGSKESVEKIRLWVRDILEKAGKLDVPVFANTATGDSWESAK